MTKNEAFFLRWQGDPGSQIRDKNQIKCIWSGIELIWYIQMHEYWNDSFIFFAILGKELKMASSDDFWAAYYLNYRYRKLIN